MRKRTDSHFKHMLKITYYCPNLKEEITVSSEVKERYDSGAEMDTSELEEALDFAIDKAGIMTSEEVYTADLLIHCDCGKTHQVWSI